MRFTIWLLLAPLACAQRPMTVDDLLAAKEIDEIQASPDGKTVVFNVTTTDVKANRSTSRLMILADGELRPVAGAPEGAGNVRWSPDGKRLAFFARREGKNAVWVLDPFTSNLSRVCDYDRGNSFLSKAGNWLAWSPDGTQLAFAGTLEPAPPAQDPLVSTRILYKTRTAFSDNRRSHIYLVPSSGGKPRAVTSGNYDEHSIDWAGAEIVFLSNRGPNPDAQFNYDLFAVNPAGGGLRQLTRTPGVEFSPRVSPDGRWIAYTATTRAITTIDSIAEDTHVWVIPFGGGAARELNGALDRRSSSVEWMPDGKEVVYTASDHGKTVLYRAGVEGGRSAALVDRKAQMGAISVVGKEGSIVFGMTDPITPREVFRWRNGTVEQLTRINADLAKEWRLVQPETLRFRSFDGTEVEGWLYPATGAGSHVPMILTIHGGPHGMSGYGFNARWQLYAARGYATLALNPRGSSGYGQKFSDGCVNNWGGGDYKDLMAGVDYALKTHPELDAAKLGVTGGSYGGFMTNWVITQTNRFKAAVASASLSNLISFYATSLYQDLVHAEFGGFPWEGDHFALLWRWSPLAYVKNVTTPTLFLHGENDHDVHITQAEEMYTALRMRGVEAALVRYPREGHGLREPKHQVDAAVRTLEWMDKFAKPGVARTPGH